MHCKSVSALLLLGVAVAAAAAAPPTVGAALSSRSDVQHFWQSLSLYPDIRQLISKTFSGTVFAPSNKAWDATMADVLPLTAEELKAIILYHIVPGPAAPLNKINDDQIFRTALPGTTVTAQYVDGKLTLEGAGSTATIIKPDILVGPADLAVVHVIDNVLLPTKAGSAGQPGSTGTVSATDLTAGTVGTTVDAVAGAVTGAVSNAVGTAQGALDTAQAATGAAGTAATDAAQQALDDAQQAVGGTSGAAGATPCPAIYLPVCSLANRTFDNACLANASNARIACQGECPCPAGTPILGEGAAAPAAGDGTGGSPCPLNYDPVCGTDGVTYGNECAAVAAKAEVECTRECPCNSPLAGPDAEAPGASDAPAAAPETAPAPEFEPEPAAAPESAPVPLSGASAASVSYVALAALAMLALLF